MTMRAVRLESQPPGIGEAEADAAAEVGQAGWQGIGSSVHFLPVHRLTWFRKRYPEQPRLPIAEQAGDEVLSLPLSARHTDADVERAVDVLRATHARLTG